MENLSRLYKFINLLAAVLFLGFACVGFFVPVLPSTPFILLASYFALRASHRLNEYIKGTEMYHMVLFIEEKAMPMKVKKRILTLATLMLMVPFVLVNSVSFRIFMITLLSLKYIYFLKVIKTKEEVDHD